MENKNKYLWILTFVSLAFGSATFNSYAQNNDVKVKAKKEEPIRIYGHADIEAAHSVKQMYVGQAGFTPSLIPMDRNQKELSNALIYDASLKIGFETKFYVDEKFSKGVIEFAADRNSLTIRRLFFETKHLTLGLKENNFCNIATFASVKVIQASWKNKFRNNFTFAVGVEESKLVTLYPEEAPEYKKHGITKDMLKAKDFQPTRDYPALSTNLQYDLSNNFGSVEVSGIMRPMSFYDSKTDKTPLIFGWGANLGTKLKLTPKVNTLTINVLYGQGIGSYIHDLSKMDKTEVMDVRIKKGTRNEVRTIIAGGAHAAFEHRWSPAVHFTIRSGINHTFNEDKNERPNAYKWGVYGGAKATYWITKRAAVGAEYIWGGRKNLDDNFKNAHHLKATATFKF
jgi:hypothetical protein